VTHASRPAWLNCATCLLVISAVLTGGAAFVLFVDHHAVRMREKAAFLPTDRAPFDVETLAFCAIEYASKSQEMNDVVFVGDSTCVAAIDPALFEGRTGFRAYNLGATGVIGLEGCEIILRSYLKHHPKPRLIVLCTHHTLLERSPGHEWVRERFLDVYGSDPHPWRFSVYSMAPIVKLALRLPIASDMGAFADNRMPGHSKHSFRSLQDVMVRQKGYWPWPGTLTGPANRCAGDETTAFSVTEAMKEDVLGILRLAGCHGIPVMVRLAPIIACKRKCEQTELNAWLDSLQAGNEHEVILGRPSLIEYAPALFGKTGPEHCNDAGAKEFTRLLAEEVERSLHDPNALADRK